jgi:hypothetical protein
MVKLDLQALVEDHRCGRLQTKADCADFNGTTGKPAGLTRTSKE